MARIPSSIEEILYRYLIDSPAFNKFARRVHARINRIPLRENEPPNIILEDKYRPSTKHKVNAFRIIWWDEVKSSFGFKRR